MKRGFTLLELLIVIVIIGVLVGLLVPAFNKLKEQSKRTQARGEAQSIETAVKAYFQEYGYWPCPDNDDEVEPLYKTTDNHEVLDRLLPVASDNTKGITFLEVDDLSRDDDGNALDPWEEPYEVLIDRRYPGEECEIAAGVDVRWGN